MPSTRKFYKNTITLVVLSEEPYAASDLHEIADSITSGDCSGDIAQVESEEVDGPTMAKLLLEQDSEPEFFGLDDQGNDLDDERDGEEEEVSRINQGYGFDRSEYMNEYLA